MADREERKRRQAERAARQDQRRGERVSATEEAKAARRTQRQAMRGGAAADRESAARRRAQREATLARYGVAPDADAATLLAVLRARGWDATVEELAVPAGETPRYRARAFRRGGAAHGQAAGPSAAAALARVLAAELAREG